jgi:hypothetical protein
VKRSEPRVKEHKRRALVGANEKHWNHSPLQGSF